MKMPGFWFWSDQEIKNLDVRLKRIEDKLTRLILSATKMEVFAMAEADEIANLQTVVNRNTDVVKSAQAALQGFVDMTQKLTEQLNAAIAADNSVAIRAAADALAANNDQLQAAIPPLAQAVAANTD
jgi:hypothetical protein